MTMTSTATPIPAPSATTALRAPGLRKNGEPLFLLLPRQIQLTRYQGKQWHAPRSAFRLTSGQTSYSKRVEAQKSLAVTKAREREMKDEKEAERQVCHLLRTTKGLQFGQRRWEADRWPEAHTSHSGQTSGEGGKGALREDGGEDA